MIKNISLILIILFFNINLLNANSNIFISVKIDDEIITNYDVEKEIRYLKILNPNLDQLNQSKIYELAKNSLINEIVKKKEVLKYVDLKGENTLVDNNLKSLITRLNYKNEDHFKEILDKKEVYSIDQIKKKINIELFWNEVIFQKYNRQVKINEKNLLNKINNLSNKLRKEYLLSEIIFSKKKEESLETIKNQIELSIKEIGFNNSANIYSISESSKLGGKIGWVSENSLSDIIINKLNNLKVGEYTDLIKIGNNYMILQIDEIKESKVEIDKQKELKRLIKIETNKQLNQFSRIYFMKSKINYTINEQ